MDGFARAQADYDNATPPEPEVQGGMRVLRVVVYLTYDDREIRHEDEAIDEVQSPFEAEQDIKRVLSRERNGLEYKPYLIECVDAKYMTQAESNA